MDKNKAKKVAAPAAGSSKRASAEASTPKRGLAWWLGFTDLQKGLATQAGVVIESGQRTAQLYRNIKIMLADVRKPGRRETFDQAVERMNLSDEHLARRKFQFSFEGWCGIAGLIACFFFFCIHLFAGRYGASVPTFIAMMLMGALAFRGFFRAWQVRERRLAGPREFIKEACGV